MLCIFRCSDSRQEEEDEGQVQAQQGPDPRDGGWGTGCFEKQLQNLYALNQEIKKALKSPFETDKGQTLLFIEMLYDMKEKLQGTSE